MGTVNVIFSFSERTPCRSLFVFFLYLSHKKNESENYVEFDLRMCTVLVRFSVF